MTTAEFNYLDDHFVSFVISGHSGYEKRGKDIVCSSITTSAYTTIGLMQRLIDKKSFSYKESDGYLELKMINSNFDQELVKHIIQNFIDVLDNIQRQYPKNLKILKNQIAK